MLADLDLAPNYRSGRDALLDVFYVPCLQEASTYDRAVGYFSSSLLHVVAVAYSDFALREGQMRLVCSPALTPEDFSAMKDGQEARDRAQGAVRAELRRMLNTPADLSATRLLATLIASEILDVRVAFSTSGHGLFHDKLGVLQDLDGRRVSFVGSANETFAAWSQNHESFEVFCSWRGEREFLRTKYHAEFFQTLWDDREAAVHVASLDKVTRDQLLEAADNDLGTAIQRVIGLQRFVPAAPSRVLMPHQEAVLKSWVTEHHHGIVNFATGAGKTLTALHALRRWTAEDRPGLVVVPGSDLHAQWTAELRRELPGAHLLLAGAGAKPEEWHRLLPTFVRGSRADPSGRPRIVLATMQTFASAAFQARMRGATELLVVVDEMHRAGSAQVLSSLSLTPIAATMGLSATYRRQWDLSGTQQLLDLLGPVLEPVIGLAEAIALHLLVPYDYRLHTVTLEEDEAGKYEDLTAKIKRSAAMSGMDLDNDYLMLLVLQRARILKQARAKVPAAAGILGREYQEGQRWLVYCDSQAQLAEMVRHCELLGLPVLEYHSAMAGDRQTVLDSFGSFGGIVAAIRCLDEGVDIPACDQALILASSVVEREYVQRRGRVLRRAPGKLSATVHDLLLVDDHGGALTRGEAQRALDFARIARNPGARAQLGLMLALSRDAVGVDFTDLPDEGGAQSDWDE